MGNENRPQEVVDSKKLDRRPIQTRSTWWARALATKLVKMGFTPNQISVSSIVFAVVGGLALAFVANGSAGFYWFLLAAVCIQLRLLANMLDGLMAVEGGGKQTKTGELYNEVPDRIADIIFLVAAGYASRSGAWGIALGWSAAVLAVNTAYIRAIGARRGQPQDFCGPQGKPHRMFLLTVACVLAAAEMALGWPSRILFVMIVIINIGTFITCIRRTLHLVRQLESA